MRTVFSGRRFLALLIGGLAALELGAADSRWISLMDGKTLNGWRAEGKADWSVENGAIVGRQGPGNTAGDLYTNGEWADFELKCEFKVAWPANTGIWFRRDAEQPGYQADILDEPNYPDSFSGSLYAMGRGFIAKNSDPKTLKKNDWNRFWIRVVGDEITIVLNGRTVVKTHDNAFLKPGRIGIQVHPGKQFAPMQVRVRKARLRPLGK